MNPQETQQVVARDEKWVPSTKRVKISSTNVRLETTVQQKKQTFPVVINIINKSTCFKAFTIFTYALEIFMQQFWYTIKKVKESDSYEFLLANKKCIVDVEVFRKIMDICPRVEGEEFSPETVDVSEESKPEPAKRRTASKRVVKKKVTIYVDDNIIPDLDVALELGKSINITEAEKEEAARQVHATHARIASESVHEPTKKKTGNRSTRSVVIQDTARVPDESTVVSATSSEGTGTKLRVSDKEKVLTKEKVILEWGSEQESEYSEEDYDTPRNYV
ncbi:hypothetical protein Tco_0602368 [Tanacetum coccineum]